MKITPRINKAIIFATKAHDYEQLGERHYRKGTMIPYIVHPFSVASIVANHTDDEDVIIAALFHDILEDISVEGFGPEVIEEKFGSHVLSTVQDCSQQIKDDGDNWKLRKDAYLEHLDKAPTESLIIVAADKIHNLLSMLEDYEQIGEEIFERFNSTKSELFWFYEEVNKKIQKSDVPELLKAELEGYVKTLLRLRKRTEKEIEVFMEEFRQDIKKHNEWFKTIAPNAEPIDNSEYIRILKGGDLPK